jgi:uncharacterized protein (DUF362 family)/NAD-dependent dihydropyrimidine dehydrogenase PreA subunit
MKLAISRCAIYEKEQVFEAVERVVDNLGGMDRFVRPGQRVLLKPNLLTAAAPEKAVTTHPFIVEAVIRLVNQLGGKVLLGDSPGFGSLEWVLSACGYDYLLEKYDLKLADFTNSLSRNQPNGKMVNKIPVARVLEEVDVIINLPKLKSHALTVYTGAIKNMFGCVPGFRKGKYHLRFSRRKHFADFIVDLYSVINPDLTIMDGIVGMEGPGPRNGFPKKIGLVLACPDGVVLDQYLTQYLGLDFKKVPLIKQALERGLGLDSLSKLEVLGDIPERIDDFMWLHGPKVGGGGFWHRRLVGEPEFLIEKCTGCQTCVQVCPPKALKFEAGKIKLDRNICIKCYCCQELCPEDVIKLKQTPWGRLWGKK